MSVDRHEVRQRLDREMVGRKLARSRAAAADAIRRGHVSVDGTAAVKPGILVDADAAITVEDPALPYVSRAALKLIGGLDEFGYGVVGRSVLDIGASTGGFTQVLLERGASHVTAIDVGHGQMADSLVADHRVTLKERVNCRSLIRDHLDGRKVDALVCDVSFISLRLALPPALALATPGTWAIILVKPQFELGPGAIGKAGLIRDGRAAANSAQDIAGWLVERHGWHVDGLISSPIAGADGNREYLLGAQLVP